MAFNGIMLAMAYYIIFVSLLPAKINVQYASDEVQLCNHLVLKHYVTTNFSASNSVDSWSKFIIGNHSDRKLLTKAHFTSHSRFTYVSSLLLLSLMKSGDVHPHPGPVFSQPPNSKATDYDYHEFQQKGIHMIHLNARSILPKLSEIKIIAQRTRAAVIGISETWLDKSVTDAEIAIDGYSVLRNDRNRQGGGVCVYIRHDFAFNPRQDLQDNHIRTIWFDLLLPKSKPITIGICYRPEYIDFFHHFESCVSKIRSDCEIMIMGDFNVDFKKPNCSLFKNFKGILDMFNFKQLIKTYTRITATSKSLIDHIICNNENKICQSGTLGFGLSDHLVTYCTRKVLKSQIIGKHKVIKIRSLRNYSVGDLLATLSSADWSGVYCSDVNQAWINFKTVFLQILDIVAPIKEIRLKNRTEPWMNKEILEKIRHRDDLLYKFRKDRTKTCLYKS